MDFQFNCKKKKKAKSKPDILCSWLPPWMHQDRCLKEAKIKKKKSEMSFQSRRVNKSLVGLLCFSSSSICNIPAEPSSVQIEFVGSNQ